MPTHDLRALAELVRLPAVLSVPGDVPAGAPDELADLYRYGDAAERRGVLRALDVLDLAGHEELARGLVADALRTNDLHRRAIPSLARMLASFAHERIAAGRTVPAEIWPLIDAHPPAEELAAIEAEPSSPVADRRAAAVAALRDRAMRETFPSHGTEG